MNRTGLAITLAIAATVGVVFALWPELDLKLAGVFFDAQRGGFWRGRDPLYLLARDASTWLTVLVAAPAGFVLAMKFARPCRPLLMPGRAVVLMLVTLALAPGSHFFSDVVAAGVLTFLVIWVTHGCLYRWKPTRTSDEAVEKALQRLARPLGSLQTNSTQI